MNDDADRWSRKYGAKNMYRGYVMTLELSQRGGTSEPGIGKHID
jgi:hypothetical protein